jgi:uncharacterized protein (TIGR02145 family)
MKTALPFFSLVLLLGFAGCKKDGITITDSRDGESYVIVEIGNQTWFAENLRYAGNIAEVADEMQWKNIFYNDTKTPAWCNFNNDHDNDATYGKLYNYWAVKTGTLCPSGWHIPTDAEWKELEMFLGATQAEADAGGWFRGAGVGKKLKSTSSLWEHSIYEGDNSSDFSALPAGLRGLEANFDNEGYNCYFWCAQDSSSVPAYYRELDYYAEEVWRSFFDGNIGFSCRCVKD